MNCTIIEKDTKTLNTKKYYYTIENNSLKRLCKDCNTLEEAEKYVEEIAKKQFGNYLIKNICNNMFLENSDHLLRLEQFGKKLQNKTLKMKRHYIELINKDFGDCYINKLSVREIESLLTRDRIHSGSWKNQYLEAFGDVYEETKWLCKNSVPKPQFKKFIRNSHKADIFTEQELKVILNPVFWDNKDCYVIFLLIASCGLRLGEARAIKLNQILFQKRTLIINGFCLSNGTRTNYNKAGSVENTRLRIAPIPTNTLYVLTKYCKEKNLADDDYLFILNGKPMSQSYLEKSFFVVLKKAKINIGERKLVPHSLRFTYVTRMRRGLSLEEVQRIVGHSSIAMTEYYTRYGVEELISSLQKAYDEAENIFK